MKTSLGYLYTALLSWFQAFAIEKHIEELKELKEEEIKDELIRAGGANYGTGQ